MATMCAISLIPSFSMLHTEKQSCFQRLFLSFGGMFSVCCPEIGGCPYIEDKCIISNQGYAVCPLYGGSLYLGECIMGGSTVSVMISFIGGAGHKTKSSVCYQAINAQIISYFHDDCQYYCGAFKQPPS